MLCVLTACQHTPIPEAQPMHLPQTFVEDSAADQFPVLWWQAFDDTSLNALVSSALSTSPNIRAVAAQVKQSQALYRGQLAQAMPEVSASGDYSRQYDGGNDNSSGKWNAGLTASYAFDFWGGIAASTEQAASTVMASQAQYRIVANTIASEVTRAWLGYGYTQAQLQLLAKQAERIETTLSVLERRQRIGQSSAADVLQQIQLKESNRAQRMGVEAQAQIYQQLLALWTAGSVTSAQLRTSVTDESSILATLPEQLTQTAQVALSALKARPDVQSAHHQLQAANAGLAVAVADRYPRFNLSASLTDSAPRLDQLLENWMLGLVGSVTQPIFDAGARLSAEAQQNALVEQRLAEYQQTLLEAAQEVQQALVELNLQQRSAEVMQTQLSLAQDVLKLQARRYALAQVDFLELLSAQQQVLSLESSVIDAQWEALQAAITLYASVSHGYFSESASTTGAADHYAVESMLRSNHQGQLQSASSVQRAQSVQRVTSDHIERQNTNRHNAENYHE